MSNVALKHSDIQKLITCTNRAFHAGYLLNVLTTIYETNNSYYRLADYFYYDVRVAAIDSILLNLSKLYKKQRDSLTIHVVLSTTQDSLITKNFEKYLESHQNELENLITLRDKFVVHIDKDQDKISNDVSLDKEVAMEIIQNTYKYLNDINYEIYQEKYAELRSLSDDILSFLECLKEDSDGTD